MTSAYSPSHSAWSVTAEKSSGRCSFDSSVFISDECVGSPLANRNASSGPFSAAIT
jgi:hypothetical protein